MADDRDYADPNEENTQVDNSDTNYHDNDLGDVYLDGPSGEDPK